MELAYLGGDTFRVATKEAVIMINPHSRSAKSETSASAKADVTLYTYLSDGVTSGMAFDGPGEYEVRGVMITGVAAQLHTDSEGENGTMYSIEADGLTLAVTGNIAPGLSKQQMEGLGTVDILVVPVGGHGLTLDATAAAELVSLLEPAYVIPVHYDDGKTTYAMPQDPADPFFKELGASPEPLAKIKISPKDLPTETVPVYLTCT